MKYITILFLLLLCFNLRASYKEYYIDCHEAYPRGIRILLDSSKRYFIFSSTYTEAQGPMEFEISAGTYEHRNNRIILTDDILGYKMEFEELGKDLKAKIFYPSLHTTFIYGGVGKSPVNFLAKNTLYRDTGIITQTDKKAKLGSGIFSYRGKDTNYSYWASTWFQFYGHTYKAYFGKLLISKGVFIQIEDTIILKDKNLNKDFVLFMINDTTIATKNFIGPFNKFFKTTKKQDRSKLDDSLLNIRIKSGYHGK